MSLLHVLQMPAASRFVLVVAMLTCIQPIMADDLQPLIESSCIACHDENTEYLERLQEHRSDFTLFSGLCHPDQNGKEPHDTEMTFLTAAINPGLAASEIQFLLIRWRRCT